jgi:AmmeMemoRadiSam system protein B
LLKDLAKGSACQNRKKGFGVEFQEKPKLRPVNAHPVQWEGKGYVVLSDPLRLSGKEVFLPLENAFILGLLNGQNTILEIKAEYMRKTGYMLMSNTIDQFIQALDENLMLDSDRFRSVMARLEEDFRRSGVRPPFHAGLSYPSDRGELKDLITSFYLHQKGPGPLPPTPKAPPAAGLVAPHIDIKSGGPVFAWAYHALAQGEPPARFVILGTAHQGAENLFCLSSLDFETPLGRVRTDRTFIDALLLDSRVDFCKDEILHRSEHTIEFQIVFLQHLYGESVPYTIVPVLCSMDPELFFRPEFEEKRAVFQEFISRLRQTIAQSPGRTCIIASVDLDHIGPRYGDAFTPNGATIQQALDSDRELLTYMEQLKEREFLEMARRINPMRKICGFGPLYTFLKVLEGVQGKILYLDHAVVDPQNSFVTFASMVFRQSERLG